LLVRGAGYVYLFGGQLRLIDEDHTARSPFEGLNHKSVVGRWPLAFLSAASPLFMRARGIGNVEFIGD